MTIDGATNRVLLAGAPTDNLGAATKAYVDSQVSGSGALPTTGGTMTGDILVSGTVNFGSSGNRITTVFATTFNGTSTLDCPDYNESELESSIKEKTKSKWRLVLYKDGKKIGRKPKKGKSRLFKKKN